MVDWPIQRRQGQHRNRQDDAGSVDAGSRADAGPGDVGTRGDGSPEPIVVWDEDLRGGQQGGRRVVAACPQAQRLGIRPFLPLHEAVEMLARSGGASGGRIERHDPAADSRGLGELADELLTEISPLVAIEPLPVRGSWAGVSRRGAESLLVDITGIGDWFGGEDEVLSVTRRWLDRFGLTARLAIADTAGAAWALTRFGELAITLIPPGEGDAVIDRLPVRSLRIDREVARQLDRLGIETIGDLKSLPRGGLATRLGPELIRRLDQVHGVCLEPLSMHHTEPEDVARCELEYPTTDREILCHRIGLLVDEVAVRLAARSRGALRLACRFELLEGRPPERIEVGLFAPTADGEHLRRLLLTLLENRVFRSMVQRIELAVDLGGPLREHQVGLFDGPAGAMGQNETAGRRALARMIETVALRLGDDAVLGVELTDHPRPESAYRLRPLAGRTRPLATARSPAPARSAGGTTRRPAKEGASKGRPPKHLPPQHTGRDSAAWGPLPSDPLRRPLTLLREPQRLWVELSERDGVLTRIRLEPASGNGGGRAQRVQRVLRCWGPERIESRGAIQGWERRDYYRVEVEDGSWWWLYRHSLAGGKSNWCLHGRFG
ncbi:MAG: DNA polymerase Y family protein [Planctomycetaceae bacterium]|nr:MAG: DNA polymerase Y family protein [Planctomycetaceae bacterium]